jgi:hypothetical protein
MSSGGRTECNDWRVEAAQLPATETSPEPAQAVSEPHSAPDPAAAQPDPNGSERDESGQFLSREAANYRRRLRETEQERDQLRTLLDDLQRAEVERLAGAAGMAVPGDLWTLGTEIANLRDDDGRIEPDTVQALVGDVLKSRPTWRNTVGSFGGGQGAAAAGHRPPKVGLSQLLKPTEAR